MRDSTWIVVLGAVVTVACADPPPKGSGGAGASDEPITTIADLLRFQRERTCRWLFANRANVTPSVREVFRDEAMCREQLWTDNTLLRHFTARHDELIRLEAEGRLRVDPEGAERCLEHAGESEVLLLGRYLECGGMIVGTQPLSGTCTINDECAGDSYCHFEGRVCPGDCRSRTGVGSPCGYGNNVCSGGRLGGTSCRLDISSSQSVTARTGSCVEWIAEDRAAGEGAPCGFEGLEQENRYTYCAQGLFCNYTEISATGLLSKGTCKRALATGDPCSSRIDLCSDDGVCAGSAEAGTCQPFRWHEEGDACDPNGLSSGGLCDRAANLVCAPSGCIRAGDGRTGSPCDGRLGQCAEGYRCEQSTCVALQPAGGPCQTSDDCLSGACGPTNTCRERYCDADPF